MMRQWVWADSDQQQEAALAQVRGFEFEQFVALLGATPVRVLELGAGHGWLARRFSLSGHTVVALDIPASEWRQHWSPTTIAYDGVNLPLPSLSVDVIVSSHVLMQVARLSELHREMRRVLKPGGYCLHSLPTPAWRLWTTVISPVVGVRKAIFCPAPKLGKRAGHIPRFLHPAIARGLVGYYAVKSGVRLDGSRRSFLGEIIAFSEPRWRQLFSQDGFSVDMSWPMGIFYTGHSLLGNELPVDFRRQLARMIGSSSRLYKVCPI
ncbi:MAG: class I SAM-dependent methyltransferase [Deltaproteobacteria bacterium]|nr:class I SAM-dependent methyltransferase [Deltaproteobacteria bacterium]MBM4297234.1 class I SAM-dependent methyltransferase [Deltaproteobacteria bacterium]